MGTENHDKHAQRAEDQLKNKALNTSENDNAETDPAGNALDDQVLVGGMSTDSPTNLQPSASQNNKWEREHNQGTEAIAGQQGSEGYEEGSKPSRQFTSSNDDELEEEQRKSHHTEEDIEENDLERTDEDYRDGENQSSGDQHDPDELRNWK